MNVTFWMDGAPIAPMFYVSQLARREETFLMSLVNTTMATGFGAIHCIAWVFAFPTTPEGTLWKTGTVFITAIPALLWVVLATAMYFERRFSGRRSHIFVALALVGNTLAVLYLLSRAILLVQAFVLLRSPPPDALTYIEWTWYIPHLS
ncbi:hypothetical protein FA15DRAFT_357425 [Coprinopsis marcescibilis]|uniref:Uncharacterized protein n=1 Tax=Coprinopsis marcescibilis TaxID=230819 RepID=A0A5C3KYC8_COPMA|nr:hypothetical protein FA15DRAFT_357425 [Coprinopsis marcescibilis]